MKKLIKVMAICLCFMFAIQYMPSEQTQYIAMEDVLAFEEIDVELAENQIESIQQYRKMLKTFNENAKTRVSGEQVYDENYGGAYIDKDGKLVVLLVDNDENRVASIKECTGNVNIRIEDCKYSFNEILDVINIMNDNLIYLSDLGICITEMYEDVYTNKVKIGVLELDKTKENIIRGIVDVPYMEIYSTDVFFEANDAVYVKGGERITEVGDGSYSSIGFAATRNGVDGLVIAGHAGNSTSDMFLYNNLALGRVTATAYENFSSADAAFVKNAGAVYTTNLIGEIAICHNTATSISDFPVGATIYKYGTRTHLTSGVIISNYLTYAADTDGDRETDIHFSNQTKASYSANKGDSGCPVFVIEGMYNGKYTCQLLGIHSGILWDGNESVFSKYYKIVEALNVQAKTY